MFAITGITGRVGGGVARDLLDAGLPVRAVVRNPAKGAEWLARGCGIATAELDDVDALTPAFGGTEGVFVLVPPNFDPAPGFPEARSIVAAVKSALAVAQPAKVVCLSTIGGQATQTNLLTQLHIAEQDLGAMAIPICFLRPAWFLENAAWISSRRARMVRLRASCNRSIDAFRWLRWATSAASLRNSCASVGRGGASWN